ncbi:hypothetical protein EVAR_20661_1 [Eumeta japonica]|uniref:Secreted protein n=1 Tax=Eumeta variegata TaxID=151549 RepID=A0A4C1VDV5_EUMVA|nr:hypothetical protein EVAR_20661_1 [Eumeta japonica]
MTTFTFRTAAVLLLIGVRSVLTKSHTFYIDREARLSPGAHCPLSYAIRMIKQTFRGLYSISPTILPPRQTSPLRCKSILLPRSSCFRFMLSSYQIPLHAGIPQVQEC